MLAPGPLEIPRKRRKQGTDPKITLENGLKPMSRLAEEGLVKTLSAWLEWLRKHGPRLVPKLVLVARSGLTGHDVVKDFGAGLTVAVVALPLAMAFAIASHVTPDKGIFTAIIGGFLISLLGGSRFAVGGPTGAFVVIIAGVVDRHGYDGLVLTTLLAGAMLLFMGVARLGRLIKFIPYPVTTGFTSGIAVLIFFSQINDFLGMGLKQVPSEFLPKVLALAQNLGQAAPMTMLVGGASLAAIVCARRFFPKIPGPVFGVAVGMALAWAFSLPVETIGTRFGGIPQALPTFSMPSLSYEAVRSLMPDAMTIALLAAIESLLCCVVADGMTGDKHRPSMELVAQGTANIASVLFGGIPATGAVARTVTSIKSGAVSPLAGCFHAVLLMGFVLLAAPVASAIPLASLSAVLLVVAFDMSEYRKFARLMRAPRSDLSVLVITFALTVFVDLTVAVYVGVLLASLLFMRRMSELTEIHSCKIQNGGTPWSRLEELGVGDDEGRGESGDRVLMKAQPVIPEGVQLYEIDGPFFFGVADRFQSVLDVMGERPKVFILDLHHTPTVDSTGIYALESFMKKCKATGIELYLAGMRPHFKETMHRLGTDTLIGHDHFFPTVADALQAAKTALGGEQPHAA